jgi:hypothetical protein
LFIGFRRLCKFAKRRSVFDVGQDGVRFPSCIVEMHFARRLGWALACNSTHTTRELKWTPKLAT